MKKIIYLFFISALIYSCKTMGNNDIIPITGNYKQNFNVISPNNDGVQDDLEIEVEIKTVNFIRFYQMEVLDESKNLVKSIGTEESLEKLQKELFLKKENIDLPKKITWDGKDNNGKVVIDGKYYYRFIIMDNKKNILDTETIKLGEFYVDTVKPDAGGKIEDTLFSPNGDGNKDTLKAEITAKYDSLETKYPELKGDDWNVNVLSADGSVVKTFKFNDKQTNVFSLSWDGKNDQGKPAADGIYKMKISSKDKGGNYFETVIPNITIDTKEDPVEISMSESLFSPNGDGVKDTIKFNILIQSKPDVVNWVFSLYNLNGNDPLKTISGKTQINDSIEWDGKNDANVILPENQYVAKLEVKYKNGNVSRAQSIPFTIDLLAPYAQIKIPVNVFSPDGNGINDKVSIMQTSGEEKTEWVGEIFDENSKSLIVYNWKQQHPLAELKWDGRDSKGSILPDGEYYYQLSCRDLAGNLYVSEKNKIIINTKPLQESISPSVKVFSTVNKTDNTISFKLNSEKISDNPATDWTITIKDKDNVPVYEENKTGELPSDYTWTGKTNNNTPAVDGEYTAVLKVNSLYGSTSETISGVFKVDNTPPVINVTTDPKIFSPDGDGENDILTLNFTEAKDDTGIKNWNIVIINPFTKKEFISFSGEGTPKIPVKWDGKGKNGALVESVLEYPVKITAEDLVGNVSTKNIAPILIDILIIKQADGRYKIRISNINFVAEKAVMTKDELNTTILDKLAKALKKFPDYTITIEGYANRYNKNLNEKLAMKLSNDRALTIADQLTKRGIAKTRIVAVGKGFENPIIELRDKMTLEELDEMAINRRVEFYLSK
jgi:flagellar hook assembly protein FlgD/outer membrane protein OmpA-like peptidoglycan-associated protein